MQTLHSRVDALIPFSDSEKMVRTSGLPAAPPVEVGMDHQLADPDSLDRMLLKCLAEGHTPDDEPSRILNLTEALSHDDDRCFD